MNFQWNHSPPCTFSSQNLRKNRLQYISISLIMYDHVVLRWHYEVNPMLILKLLSERFSWVVHILFYNIIFHKKSVVTAKSSENCLISIVCPYWKRMEKEFTLYMSSQIKCSKCHPTYCQLFRGFKKKGDKIQQHTTLSQHFAHMIISGKSSIWHILQDR